MKDEEIAHETHRGGPNNQVITTTLQIPTPTEFLEPHMFNYEDGRTKYGSVLAASYEGGVIKISYQYELRIYHHASFGSDSLSTIQIPVTMACPQGNFPPSAQKRRNSGSLMRNQTENFLNDMIEPQQQPPISRATTSVLPS